MANSHCEIILGSYEEFILGYKYTLKAAEAEQTFAVHSHTASIRCLTNYGTLLASGGSDDRIIVYDLRTRKEHCLLNHHNDTVNCLQFTNDHTHLMSGGQDGLLAIVRVGSWQVEKMWAKAHQGAAILDIAIHPTGKLALSLGADATLRTWNLIKGRQAYVINLNSKSKEPRNLQSVKWAADAVRFVLIGGKYTDIWSIETGAVVKEIEHSRKVTCCIWHADSKLIVGYEDGHIAIVKVESGEVDVYKAHENRVKSVSMFGKCIITASSNGEVKVWSRKMKELCVVNADCRLTCMCIIPGEKPEITDATLDQSVDKDESGVDRQSSIDECGIKVSSKRKQEENASAENLCDDDNHVQNVSFKKKTKKKRSIDE